ncbi:HIT family protein [Dactylosporangium sp. CS-033363]|uniref:HIT family protein n=1 Tax=Dactylosporangium sp. CS-033363 TaxID=3239935 RepID=UPI003D94969F
MDRFLAHLPIGAEPVPFDGSGIPGWEIFPFEGDLRIKTLEPPVLPEPPRDGEEGPDTCRTCADPERGAIWSDERWVLRHAGGPTAVPAVLLLWPRAHHDFADLPPDLAAELVPLQQRVEKAIHALGGIARVHITKVGDGASHMHWWFVARPEGLMQLRGSCLVLWDDILPRQPEDTWRAVLHAVAETMAAGGGTAHA